MPRVVEALRKAVEWGALLESGQDTNQAGIARREGLTRARVTQVVGMLCLAPNIQEHTLSMQETTRRPAVTERALRPITQLNDPKAQLQGFSALVK